jgi:desulfoferrodoxin (superoxide reductase-like protein)
MLEAVKLVTRHCFCITMVSIAFLCSNAGTVFANKTSVTISAPASAAPGSEITIQVTATHSANNFLHYTDWLFVTVNGKEIARWNFTRSKRPESSVFTREIKYTVNENAEIKAEGHCNMHGSKGPATAQVVVTNPAN